MAACTLGLGGGCAIKARAWLVLSLPLSFPLPRAAAMLPAAATVRAGMPAAWRGRVDVVGIATTRRNQAIADAVFRAFPMVIPGVFNQPVAVVITTRGWIATFACHLIVAHLAGR